MSSKAQKRNRLSAAIWAYRQIWNTSSKLVALMLITTTVRGVLPAGFAIVIRGLVNSVTQMVAEGTRDYDEAMFWVILSMLIALAEVILVLLGNLFREYLKNDLTLKVNSLVMRHASALDLPFLENATNRELLGRVRQNPGARLQALFIRSLESTLALIQVVSLLAVLVWLEPLIVLIAPILAVPFFVFHWRLARARYMTEYDRNRDRRWSNYFLSQVTSPETIAEVKHLNLGNFLADRFVAMLETFRAQDRKLQLRQFRGSTIFSVITVIAFYLLFARVVYQVLNGALTIGDMAIFAGAVAQLRNALQSSIRSAANAYEQTLFTADLRNFLQTEPQVLDSPTPIFDPIKGSISVNRVNFTYPGSDEQILHDITFSIDVGEKIAIVGENGSGKSTMAKLLVRHYDADSGAIAIDGKPIACYALPHLHSRIALLSQTYGRYEASMAENIAYGDWDRLSKDRETIEHIASMTGLDRLADRFPKGLDTTLGRMFSEHNLSAGQWQLLAVARTLARNASILILDEPTSNIDVRSEHSLFQAVENLTRGLTTIIISHRFSTIRMMDRILMMHKGRIVEQGSHHELIAAKGRYWQLYLMHDRYRATISE